MGAYLSQPITKKVSSDGQNEYLSFGDSSMQGWRVSQEDAHNSIPELEPGCAMFAVYDGHGGHEVAAYTAQTLPAAIRDHPLYSRGQVRDGLRQAFLEFDSSLTQPEVIDKLKTIAGREAESEEDEETDREVDELFQEAHMPLEELMARYQGDKAAATAAGVAKLKTKTKEKPLSPFLRAKAGGSGAGGSSSNSSGGGSSSDADAAVQKDLAAELADAKPEPNADAKPEPNADAENSEAGPNSDTKQSKSDAEVKPASNSESLVKSESNSDSAVKSDSNSESVVNKSESNSDSVDKSDSQPKTKTNGTTPAAGGEPTSATTTTSPTPNPDTNPSNSAGGDAPACNGNGTADPETPRVKGSKGGKGARPGSGKSPAPAEVVSAQRGKAAGRATRKMPERAAAEVYRDVLEGARKAREAGHDHVEDEEEEEEEDDDFSLEQSDSLDDEDNDVDDDDDDSEEEEDEVDEEEDSEQEEDELGDEEEAGDDEDGDFMLNMKDEPGSDSGCTAVVAVLHGRQLYVANIGDSRCVLSRSGRAVDMSDDHKPEDEPELQRIVKAGGKVTMDGRVNGGLNLSRAFGDHAYKTDKSLPAEEQMISACPDIRCVTIEPGTDEFMVLACDGIWNSKKSQEVVDFVSERIREKGETQLSKICEELFDECLAPNTMGDGTGCDNMTCIIVRFLPSLARVAAPAPAEGAEDADNAASAASAAPRPEGEPPEKRRRTE